YMAVRWAGRRRVVLTSFPRRGRNGGQKAGGLKRSVTSFVLLSVGGRVRGRVAAPQWNNVHYRRLPCAGQDARAARLGAGLCLPARAGRIAPRRSPQPNPRQRALHAAPPGFGNFNPGRGSRTL